MTAHSGQVRQLDLQLALANEKRTEEYDKVLKLQIERDQASENQTTLAESMLKYLINSKVRQDHFAEAVNPGKYYAQQLTSNPAQKKMQVAVQNVADSVEK